MRRYAPLLCALTIAIAAACVTPPAQADASDSARVGDMHYGNGLDPTGWDWLYPDPRGFSWLHRGMLRTPSGALYPFPPRFTREPAEPASTVGTWHFRGVLELGYLDSSGDTQAQFFRQYDAWRRGPILGMLALYGVAPATGDYLEVRASAPSGDDNYLRLRTGRLGSFKLQAFHRNMPHTVASNAWPLWRGVGSTELTLPDPLVPGHSSVAQVRGAAARARRKPVGLVRARDGLSIESKLFHDWIGFASVRAERRKGTRLWGGTMYFNYKYRHDGGVLETVRPIDFTTTNLEFGLRHVGKVWRFNSSYTGSFFRDHKDFLNYESPFGLYNTAGTPPVGNIHDGEFSLEPDNDYHHLRAELARSLPWHGELSLAAALGTMRQNDALRAPVTCTGKGGVYISPEADYTFNCADWNTTAALSRDHAQARIDTRLAYAKAVFRPSPALGWHVEARWYDEDNKTRYLAWNPLTGQYGYIAENGAKGSIEPGKIGIFDPHNPLFRSYWVQVRSIPFSWSEARFEVGANWHPGADNTVDLTWRFNRERPRHRERSRVDERRVTLAWVNRAIGDGTLRVSAEYARRRGDAYNYDPFRAFYSPSLPGFVTPAAGLPAFTTSAMRKYDLSDRDEAKLRAIAILPLGPRATLSTTLHGKRDDYHTAIGRQRRWHYGATVHWLWQRSPRDNLSAWLGVNRARIDMANVFDIEGLLGNDPRQSDPTLGGPLYPLFTRWTANDRERNQQVGIDYFHHFGRVRLKLGYQQVRSKDRVGYAFSAGAGGAFPDIRYRMSTIHASVDVDLTPRVGLRLFERRQSGSYHNWHYAGLNSTPVIDHRIYTDRGPRAHYVANLFGVLLRVRL